jgi:fatty acid desaturase
LVLALQAVVNSHLNLFFMKKNMGNTDRIVRLLLAAVIAILYFTNTITGTLGIVLLVLAGVFVITSLVSFCPLYTLVGLNTCSAKKG